jgi:glycosyltransferase involved in cell wall biosynthesis
MIPLRIVHVLADPGTLEAEAAANLVAELQGDLHENAHLLAVGGTCLPGTEALVVELGPWRWWLGGRTRALRTVAAWTPDLIHVHGAGTLMLAAALDLGQRLGLPVVVSLLGTAEIPVLRRLKDPRVAWTLVPSAHHRARCVGDAGLARDRVALLPCGVAIPGVPASPSDEHWVVGAITGPGRGNGIERLEAAVQSARAAGSPVRLRLWSADGDARAARPDSDVVTESGTDLGGFLDSIDVFAEPGDREIHLLPLLMAMARARPVLAAAVGAVAEVVPDGEAGLLVPPDDGRALAEALRQLDLPSRRSVLARGARRIAEDRFAIATIAHATVEMYRSALGGGGVESGRRSEITSVYRRVTERLR